MSVEPLLLTTVKRRDVGVATVLLEHRAAANAKDIYGSTLLATLSGTMDGTIMAALLIVHGARR